MAGASAVIKPTGDPNQAPCLALAQLPAPHRVPALVPRNVTFPETRRAPWSVQGSDSCRRPACCRHLESPVESVDLVLAEPRQRPESGRASRPACRASGSCGTASAGKPARLVARERCGGLEIRKELECRSRRP